MLISIQSYSPLIQLTKSCEIANHRVDTPHECPSELGTRIFIAVGKDLVTATGAMNHPAQHRKARNRGGDGLDPKDPPKLMCRNPVKWKDQDKIYEITDHETRVNVCGFRQVIRNVSEVRRPGVDDGLNAFGARVCADTVPEDTDHNSEYNHDIREVKAEGRTSLYGEWNVKPSAFDMLDFLIRFVVGIRHLAYL